MSQGWGAVGLLGRRGDCIDELLASHLHAVADPLVFTENVFPLLLLVATHSFIHSFVQAFVKQCEERKTC